MITAKLYTGKRFQYPNLQTAIKRVGTLCLYSWSHHIMVHPLKAREVQFFDELDLPIPMWQLEKAYLEVHKPVSYSYPTLLYGYKRTKARYMRRPRTMQAIRNGMTDLPTSWDDQIRSNWRNNNWKRYRKVQYK